MPAQGQCVQNHMLSGLMAYVLEQFQKSGSGAGIVRILTPFRGQSGGQTAPAAGAARVLMQVNNLALDGQVVGGQLRGVLVGDPRAFRIREF